MATVALVDVRDIVAWIKQIEERVGRLYAKAAAAFSDDPLFSAFLRGLSQDEESHARFMSLASEQLREARHRPPLDILLDGETRSAVEDLLERFAHLLTRTESTKRDVVEYLARTEASELNPIFLYIAEEYRRAGREGERMTGEIQGHLLRIQDFVDDLPRDLKPSVDVATLPFVGEDRFLVVEDHAPLRRLLASLLARRGAVDTAPNGREGLDRLREHFHDGIVTDMQMPGMDGLEFHRRAIRYDARLGRRFVFCSGDLTPAEESYLREHDLPFLHKPFGLEAFQEAMDTIMRGRRRGR